MQLRYKLILQDIIVCLRYIKPALKKQPYADLYMNWWL